MITAEDNVGTLLTGQADLLQHNPICILMVFRRCPCLHWPCVGRALLGPVGFHPRTNQLLSLINGEQELFQALCPLSKIQWKSEM